jgi:hypothetical protein
LIGVRPSIGKLRQLLDERRNEHHVRP